MRFQSYVHIASALTFAPLWCGLGLVANAASLTPNYRAITALCPMPLATTARICGNSGLQREIWEDVSPVLHVLTQNFSEGHITDVGATTESSTARDSTERKEGARRFSNANNMRIDRLYENNVLPLQAESGIWPGPTYSYFGVSKSFNAADSGANRTPSPFTPLFVYAVNDGTQADVVGIVPDCVVKQNGGTCFGANPIVRTVSGVNSAKLVGMEIDIEPAADATVSAGSGIFLNAFDLPMPIPAIQLGGLSGGKFLNGFLCAAVSGSCNAAQIGMTSQSYMDTRNGTFTTAAIIIGNQQLLRLEGSDGNPAYITTDGNKMLKFVSGTNGWVLTNQQQTKNLIYIAAANGNIDLGIKDAAIIGSANDNLNLRGGAKIGGGTVTSQSPLKLPAYTVRSLPNCNVSEQDAMTIVTDAIAPSYRGVPRGGGRVRTPVYCDGTSWTTH